MKTNYNQSQAGFTLVEVLMAAALTTLVSAAVLTTFIWCLKQATLSTKISWSQNQAMRTAAQLTSYLRNANEIVSIDEVGGTWVELRFPDGNLGRLVYSNEVPDLRDGRMFIIRTNGTETLVTRGLTEIQTSVGFSMPMFSREGDNSVRVAFRVSEPTSSGIRDANDGLFAATMRFSACLRNVEP